MAAIQPENFVKALQVLLDETFDNVHGAYLDKNTSMFETLKTINAKQASIPIGQGCATLAAQVKHVAFYLDVVVQSVNHPDAPPADWDKIWRTVNQVTEEEWVHIQSELRENYNRILDLIQKTNSWDDVRVMGGAIAMITHTAYHLGEIRQALCFLRTEV